MATMTPPSAGPTTRTTAAAGVAPDRARREQADLELLAGPPAGDVLRAVLDAEGVALEHWAVHRVHHRPGVGVTVGWTVTWTSGPQRGEEYLLGTTAPLPEGAGTGPGVTSVVADGRDVHVWRHPADPVLPDLVTATDPAAVAAVLDVPVDEVELHLVTYRPLRRAVVRVRAAGRTWFWKVVRPHTAEGMLTRHRMLLDAGVPVAPARSAGPGLLVLDEVAGRPLTDAFAADGAAGYAPDVVRDVLDRLPAGVLDLPRRPSWSERVRHHAHGAASAVPDRAAEITALGERAARLVASSDAGPVVPTHGDLHEANLLVAEGAVVGLLDVDAAGPGHRVDDYACLLGHLSVLPALAPQVHRHVPDALPRWVAAFEREVDPVALHARSGAVALSLVGGATSSDDAAGRLDAARAWVERAEALAGERPLMATSSASHPAPGVSKGQTTRTPREQDAYRGRTDQGEAP